MPRAQTPRAIHLRTESVVDPPAIASDQPRLSWWALERRRGAQQSAFEVRLWTNRDTQQPPLYRSGRVLSPAQTSVLPPGLTQSGQQYTWRVRIWDERARAGPWSQPARFHIGLLHPADWSGAQWIGSEDDAHWRETWNSRKRQEFANDRTTELTPVVTSAHKNSWQLLDSVTPRYDPAPLLRKSVAITAPVRSAHLYVSGVGYATGWVNGHRLDTSVLDPGWTNYQRDVLYRTYDLTAQLHVGQNALAFMLGRGFYGMLANDRWGFADHAPWIAQPALKALLVVEYQDGSRLRIPTDSSWKTAPGPVLYDDPWLGEVYDAREEKTGWSNAAFPDTTWANAHLVQGPAGLLRPQIMPSIQAVDTATPRSIKQVEPGVWLIDLGVDIAGWMRLTLRGHAGDKVLVQMAEKPDPHTFIDTTTNNFQQFGYVLKGVGIETAESHFAYMGFRYARITLTPAAGAMPFIRSAKGVYVHTAMASAGHWTSSNPLLNDIETIWRRTQLNNVHSIPTDCPHREKLGWMADAFIAQPAAIYSFNPEAFYTNFAQDLAGTQGSQGTLSTIAPSFGYTQGDSPLWASAEVWIPWRLYVYDGNTDVLRQQLPTIERYLEATVTHNQVPGKPYILNDVLGDWDSPGHENPPEGQEAYSTAYFYLNCRIASRMARIVGDKATAVRLEREADNIAEAFNHWFYSPQQQIYRGFQPTGYRQSINALALWTGLVDDPNRAIVYQHLREDVLAHESHLNTGIIGTKPLLEVLADHGDTDLVYRIVTQTTYPSWGYMLKHGATTMWESWDGHDSLDHPMQGTVVEFFYRYLAGLRAEEDHPGFAEFSIAPIFPKALGHAAARFESPRGTIVSGWSRRAGGIALHLQVPFNTRAHVRLPTEAGKACTVREDRRPLTSQPAAPSASVVRFDLASGRHELLYRCR